jgi:DUF4097 and DUF4098 domain-containing protein YvlB
MFSKQIIVMLVILISAARSAWYSPTHASVTQVSYKTSTAQSNGEYPLAMGKKVTIDLEPGGSIEITGWDKPTASIELSARCSEDECKPQIETTSEGLEIRLRSSDEENYSNSNVTLTLSVPSRTDIDLNTSGGGVTISKVEGKFTGETMGGEINLTSLKGTVNMTTMGGDITVKDSSLDGRLQTMGGEVLFEDVIGGVKGSSMGGKVTYRNVRPTATSEPSSEVRITSMGGEINVDSAPAGADLKTMGGDIHVASANDHVRCHTMGGDIHLDSVNGWIDATTMGGNVVAKMTGDAGKSKRDVTIDSKGGDIELTVPANLSMNIDLTIAVTRGHEGDAKIISDFDLKQSESDSWDDRHGTPRKYVYGTGTAGSGSNRIKITTINGNIRLKKGS